MTATVSIVVPTRERAAYLPHCIRSCTLNPDSQLEILILDNASTDNTQEVAAGITDPRVRYVRNDARLSMRDNFEKGIELSRGEVICFIGDDDGVLPDSVARATQLFENPEVDAVSASRAHYYWPDLVSSRRNTALLPRHSGVSILDARTVLATLLEDADYYRLPCLYHGFVRRSVVNRVKERQGRFFLSSQVDMFSAIALSMEGIHYAFSRSPLVINGGSARSNGASHFGGGTQTEKSLWKKEDDVGFLPGFENAGTIGALIVESGIRYSRANPPATVFDMFGREAVERALAAEAAKRAASADPALQERNAQMFETAGISQPRASAAASSGAAGRSLARITRLIKSFASSRPIDMSARGVTDVFDASQYLAQLLKTGHTSAVDQPWEQLTTAFRMSRN